LADNDSTSKLARYRERQRARGLVQHVEWIPIEQQPVLAALAHALREGLPVSIGWDPVVGDPLQEYLEEQLRAEILLEAFGDDDELPLGTFRDRILALELTDLPSPTRAFDFCLKVVNAEIEEQEKAGNVRG